MNRTRSAEGQTRSTWALIQNWNLLAADDHVEIYCGGEAVDAGTIDMLSYDGKMLWLQARGIDRRRLFLRSEVSVYRKST